MEQIQCQKHYGRSITIYIHTAKAPAGEIIHRLSYRTRLTHAGDSKTVLASPEGSWFISTQDNIMANEDIHNEGRKVRFPIRIFNYD